MTTPAKMKVAGFTPGKHLTPALRVNSPLPKSVMSNRRAAELPINDDAAEKRRRRLEAANAASPAAPAKRKDTESGSQWTNVQLADHYSQCIKLSSENKINAKNAFGLHLIDHMAQMLKSKGEMTNFQVAGCTLDAGAKIYAGRVDAMYNDVYKMLGGLGRNSQEQEDGDPLEGESGKTKRRKSKKSTGATSQIVKDVSTLNIDHYDLEFEVDPLFKKMSATFDEGGVAGLLMNQLQLDSDHCRLMLDASCKLASSVAPINSIPVDMGPLARYLSNLGAAKICPTLAGFSFGDDGGSNSEQWSTRLLLSSTEKSVPPSNNFQSSVDGGTDVGCLQYSSGDDNGDDNPLTVPDNDDAPPPPMGAVNTIMFDDNTCTDSTYDGDQGRPGVEEEQIRPPFQDLLASSEYSYFSQAAVDAWAGPQHWKLRPRSNDQAEGEKDVEKTVTKRQPRRAFKIDFLTPLPDNPFDTVKVTGRKLSKLQMQKITIEQTTLPSDSHIAPDSLLHLFNRSSWIVKRQERKPTVQDEPDAQQLYDYENINDQENYCAPVMLRGGEGPSDDDDDDCGRAPDENDTVMMPFINNTQQLEFNQTCNLGSVTLTGISLLTAPSKIEQIKVNFARQAKRINMQKLKSSMWSMIDSKQTDAGNLENFQDRLKPKDGLPFSQLYSKLPTLLSQSMAKDISVPIAFVSLLHLANEKNLSIQNMENDIVIRAPGN